MVCFGVFGYNPASDFKGDLLRMPSYLLAWNPLKWNWKELEAKVKQFNTMGFTDERWSCGKSKRIMSGDRIYLIRLGKEPRGIIASGVVFRDPSKGKHRENIKRIVHYVDIRFDKFIESPNDVLIDRVNLKRKFPSMHWDTQVSGIFISDDISERLAHELSLEVRGTNPFGSGIIDFSFANSKKAHSMFQEWRRSHPDGFFLNCKTTKTAMIHSAQCRHLGNTEWQASSEASLGKTPKICSENYNELKAFASRQNLRIEPCQHCMENVVQITRPEHRQLSLQTVEEVFSKKLEQSMQLSSKQRKLRLSKAPKRPQTAEAQITIYIRNPDVVAEVLARSKGYCESCGHPAPFVKASDGTPYLEVHHKVRLADGGDDTIENALAMCPNCHRMAHYG